MPKKAFLHLPPETRESILQKTVQIYTEHPFEKITLQMLLDALSLHPTTFYRYFEDKDELYLYTYMVLVEKLDNDQRAKNPDFDFDIFTFYENMGSLTEQEQKFLTDYTALPQDVLLRAHLEVFKDGLFKRYRAALRRLRAEGRLYDDIDEDLIAYMYATTMLNFNLFCREYGIDEPEVMNSLKKNFYMNFFRRGLLKNPEKREEKDECCDTSSDVPC